MKSISVCNDSTINVITRAHTGYNLNAAGVTANVAISSVFIPLVERLSVQLLQCVCVVCLSTLLVGQTAALQTCRKSKL
jgi:hypothetical protein